MKTFWLEKMLKIMSSGEFKFGEVKLKSFVVSFSHEKQFSELNFVIRTF